MALIVGERKANVKGFVPARAQSGTKRIFRLAWDAVKLFGDPRININYSSMKHRELKGAV
jgi:hypothetical protein